MALLRDGALLFEQIHLNVILYLNKKNTRHSNSKTVIGAVINIIFDIMFKWEGRLNNSFTYDSLLSPSFEWFFCYGAA